MRTNNFRENRSGVRRNTTELCTPTGRIATRGTVRQYALSWVDVNAYFLSFLVLSITILYTINQAMYKTASA